ncbi:MAG: hypothetical protein ACI8QS_000601 [Planctomycetota bacterium]|jgi:hypothetical protein
MSRLLPVFLILTLLVVGFLIYSDRGETPAAKVAGVGDEELLGDAGEIEVLSSDDVIEAIRRTSTPESRDPSEGARRSSSPTTSSSDAARTSEPTEGPTPPACTKQEILALAGLPPDTPLALQFEPYYPPDPMERGTSSLELELTDGSTGKPMPSGVILWRIDAPANYFWKRGDQAVAFEFVGSKGFRFENLADGRYRPFILEERRHAVHQAVIEVTGNTQASLSVEMPGRRQVFMKLILLDPGSPSVQTFPGFKRTSRERTAITQLAPWVNTRHFVRSYWDECPNLEIGEIARIDFPRIKQAKDSRSQEWGPLFPVNKLYDLGEIPEDVRGTHFVREVYVQFNERSPRRFLLENPMEDPGRGVPIILELVP